MELAERECIIISDGDATAKERQKDYFELDGYGIWKRYDELLSEPPIVTGEDFIKIETFRAPIKEVHGRYSALGEFDESKMAAPQGKLYALSQWLQSGTLDKETRATELRNIKDQVFNKLKPSDIEDSYFQFLSKLADLV